MMLMGISGPYGLGDAYSADTTCSAIPAGDPYRTSGNYCTQPSGNVMEFNADGSVDPDPYAGPDTTASQASSSSSQTAWWQSALTAITKGVTSSALPTPPAPKPVAPAATPWYMTPVGILGIVIAIGGGAYMLANRRPAPRAAA